MKKNRLALGGFVSMAALGAAVLASSPALAQTQAQTVATSAHVVAVTKGTPGEHQHWHSGQQSDGGLDGLVGGLLQGVENLLSGL